MLQVIDQHGNVEAEGPWVKNLLLNQGMDAIAEVFFADLFLHSVIGTGTLATVLDSGATTVAQALTVATANAPIFTPPPTLL